MAEVRPNAGPVLGGAIVLAGGGGRRLGGLDKPGLLSAGTRLLDVALAAVRPVPGERPPDARSGRRLDGAWSAQSAPAHPVVVVGPPRRLPAWAVGVREDPPGGGPAAAVAAGVRALGRDVTDVPGGPADRTPVGPVVLVAADLPRVSRATIARLVGAVSGGAGAAVLVDDTGRRQLLLAAWRPEVLLGVVDELVDGGHGRPLRSLYDGIAVVEVAGRDHEWSDVDTPQDRRRWWPAG